MARTYNDVGTEYSYQRKLREKGYVQLDWATFFYQGDCPAGFEQPNTFNGWIWRREIKRFLIKQGIKDFKIVIGTGYWRDLHSRVYEIWIKK